MHYDGSHSPGIQSPSISDIARHRFLLPEEGRCRLNRLGHTLEFPQPSLRQVYHHWPVFSAAVWRRKGKEGEVRGKGRGNGGQKGRVGDSDGEEKERGGGSKEMWKEGMVGGREGERWEEGQKKKVKVVWE